MAQDDTHDVQYEEYEESWTGRLVIAGVVALALIAGAFFAGKAMAGSSGPATLAEAVTQAQKGDLPCGETATTAGAANANGAPPADGAAAAGGGGAGGAGANGGAFFLRAICNQDGTQGVAGQNGGAAGGRGRFGGGFGGQTVTAVTADSLTLNGPNGATTVKIDGNTVVNKTSAGTVADIKKGDTVMVGGFGGGGAGGAGGGGAAAGTAARSITILPQAAGSGS